MGKRLAIVAMTVLSIATTGLWSIPLAHGQSLTETTTAVGIAGDQHGRAGSNVLGAAGKARNVAKQANQARGDDHLWEGNDPFQPKGNPSSAGAKKPAMTPASSRSGNKTHVSGTNLEKAFASMGDKALEAMVGQTGTVKGRVAEILEPDGQTFVIVREPGVGKEGPSFMFRYNGKPSLPFKVGEEVELSGVFALRHQDKEIGVTYVYDVSAPGAPVAGNAPAADMYHGWRYRGCVLSGGGTTGVFEHTETKETIYAKPGKSLDKDVVVLKIEMGEAKLKVADRTLPIIP